MCVWGVGGVGGGGLVGVVGGGVLCLTREWLPRFVFGYSVSLRMSVLRVGTGKPPNVPLSDIPNSGCVPGFLLFSHNPLWQPRLPHPAPGPEAAA